MKRLCTVLACLLVAGLVLVGCASPAPAATPAPAPKPTPASSPAPAPAPSPTPKPTPTAAAPATIKAVTVVAATELRSIHFKMFVEELNKRGAGQLSINYLGGPEVVPAQEQGTAVKNGVVDMVLSYTAFHEPLAPGADALGLTELTAAGERASGAIAMLDGIYQKNGIKLLGRGIAPSTQANYNVFLKKPITRPQELAGLKMWGGVVNDPPLKALGSSVVSMVHGDVYTALERGMIDGMANAWAAVKSYSWFEQIKYAVVPSFFSTNTVLIMNLSTWNKLSASQQKLLQDTLVDMEPQFVKLNLDTLNADIQFVKGKGVQEIKFSPADEKWYYDTVTSVKRDDLLKKYPDVAPKLLDLLKKK